MTKTNQTDWQEKIEAKIFNFIAYKSRTTWEVEQKIDYYLEKRKTPSPSDKKSFKSKLLEKLSQLKLLNDLDYAENYLKERIDARKPVSSIQIKKFLGKKGLSRKVIEQALKKFSREEEKSQALKDAQKKFPTYQKRNKKKAKRLLIQYLSRKGYPYDVVYSVVDSLPGVK
jgi:SOS response regulatory protein OraA/RecX